MSPCPLSEETYDRQLKGTNGEIKIQSVICSQNCFLFDYEHSGKTSDRSIEKRMLIENKCPYAMLI